MSKKSKNDKKYNHYFKKVKHLKYIDVYRVLVLFGVTSPGVAHAVKKLLCAGGRGVKDARKDIEESIDSLLRVLDIEDEDSKAEAREAAKSKIKKKLKSARKQASVDFSAVAA